MTAGPAPVRPVPAATLMLLRDGADGLEVLMTTRHREAGFAAEAMVFPGGKVNPGDHALARSCAASPGLDEAALTFRVAALRETFEECGLLLARIADTGAVLSQDMLTALFARRSGATDFMTVIAEARLELATDLLVPFAHWITPADQPKRFDTKFFLAPAPATQVAVPDGREAVDAVWTTPEAALAGADAGRIKLILATRMNLVKLGRAGTVAAALEAARRDTIVTVQPQLVQTPDGPVFRIPAEAGYGLSQMPLEHVRRA